MSFDPPLAGAESKGGIAFGDKSSRPIEFDGKNVIVRRPTGSGHGGRTRALNLEPDWLQIGSGLLVSGSLPLLRGVHTGCQER
ncbi:unnamed protein product [Protopolystoma xenopodis]|uniref:Uncharacterized protein n=1 Tax=Protopolystoma xenopodis TaxID=117903 RepID=A0A3S5BR45_9PLAT|nr:unnamed protein product [Protopolystoma xenopodis]